MKKSVMKKWVAALRGQSDDGEYSQGAGLLCDSEDKFCCLGVLCNIAPDYTGNWELDEFGLWGFMDSVHTGSKLRKFDLPQSVQEWAGMKDNAGALPMLNGYLTELNDGGRTFEDIANIIEDYYKSL